MSNLLTADIIRFLQTRPCRPLIITAGNSFRSDDGVGPYVAALLKSRNFDPVIDAGYTPENILDEVVALKPAAIVFIDAADFGGQPGEVRVIEPETVSETLISTHMIPLPMVAGLIADQIQTEIGYIGIQVKSLDFGEGLTPSVQAAADELAAAVIACQTKGG